LPRTEIRAAQVHRYGIQWHGNSTPDTHDNASGTYREAAVDEARRGMPPLRRQADYGGVGYRSHVGGWVPREDGRGSDEIVEVD